MKKIICSIIFILVTVLCLSAFSSAVFAEESATDDTTIAATSEPAEEEEEDSTSFMNALGKRILISSLVIIPIAVFLGIRSGNKKYGKN